MEWIERLNKAVNYIEEHITEEIDYGQTAKIACCSSYHFQRMFAYMAGVPLSEYIRRRRMSLAAADLQGTQEKVIDIALKYGYSSPTAFNRAFQGIHGIAPSLAREGNVPVKSYPPLSFKIIIKGVEEMNYKIVEKEAFRIIGVSAPLSQKIEDNFSSVPKLWDQAAADGTIPRLLSKMNQQPAGILGVCDGVEDSRYFIAVSSSLPAEDGWDEYLVPAFTWAIFSGEGKCPQAIQELEQRIVTEWLPASGYEYDNGPDVEVYLSPDPSDSKFEVWIPVKKALSVTRQN